MAGISIPYVFSPSTTILSAQVNSNFSTLGTNALNRTGDSMTGTLTAMNIAAVSDAAYDIGASGTRFRDGFFSRNVTVAGTSTIATAAITTLNATTLAGTVTCAANVIDQPELKRYLETKTAPTISSNVLTLDLSTGNHFGVAFTADVTTLTISNAPASGKAGAFTLALTANGTPHTVTWGASVKWPSGTAPTITSTNGKVDLFSFLTFDGGTTWWGIVVGQNF